MSAFTWSWPSVRTFCSIFCCPPVPSRIAAKLAFVPPEPTYLITDSADSTHKVLHLTSSADWQFGQIEFDMMEPCTTTTSRSETIACIYIRAFPSARYTIMFSHGNAVDLGHMTSFLVFLSRHLRVNIFSYDYAGYGASSGSPSEANLYADAQAAFLCLTGRYGVQPSSIVLYGQSIGTVPTVDLASKHKDLAGVVLHSPLTSGMRIVFPSTKDTCFFDAFPSIDKVKDIEAPVLVIHGTEDEVIDVSHGQLIYQRCPNKAEPLWVEGAGHNDIEQYHVYLERLIRFLEVDVPTG